MECFAPPTRSSKFIQSSVDSLLFSIIFVTNVNNLLPVEFLRCSIGTIVTPLFRGQGSGMRVQGSVDGFVYESNDASSRGSFKQSPPLEM
jgi:hypothetical protein